MRVFPPPAFDVDVPDGRSGRWEITRRRGPVELFRDGAVWMSVTPDEVDDHTPFVEVARGRVLITGLGLGMVLQAVALKPDVTHVTVVELEPDVVKLVAPHYEARFGDKISIVCGDARWWRPQPGVLFDYAWHDIWPTVAPGNAAEMREIMARYKAWCRWQDCWGADRLIL